MRTYRWPVTFLCLFLGLVQFAQAAEPKALERTWKVTLPPLSSRTGTINLTVLAMFSPVKDGWVADVADYTEKAIIKTEPKIERVKVNDSFIQFDVTLGNQSFSFDGKLSADGKKIQGIYLTEGRPFFTDFYTSELKKLEDGFALSKETLEQSTGPSFFAEVIPVLKQAQAKKLSTEFVRTTVDRAMSESAQYGARWQRSLSTGIATTLAEQESFHTIAIEVARQADRMRKPTDEAAAQLLVLDALSDVLKKAKKPEEARPVDLQIAKLEARELADLAKNPPFPVEASQGRKAKSDRVVLVEFFTGASCNPCAVYQQAIDGLERTFPATEVLALQYHFHVPELDPLSMKETEDRLKLYKVQGFPAIAIAGKTEVEPKGMALPQPKAKYDSLRKAIQEQLEISAPLKLSAKAEKKDNKVQVDAKWEITDDKALGEKPVIRFALVEDRVRYSGTNGIRYHQSVVRAMPGGAAGIELSKTKDRSHSLTFDIEELKAAHNKYLDDFAKEVMEEFPERPAGFKNLRLVVFIQDETSKTVWTAVQVNWE